MEQIDYYDRVGVSNSYLSHFENILLHKSKGKKFKEFSWANFVGSCVHNLMEGKIQLSDIIVSDTFTANLKGKQLEVWDKVVAGMEVDVAIRDTYKKGVDAQIAQLAELWKDFKKEEDNHKDKINISIEKLKWGYLDNEKADDNYTLFVIQRAYQEISAHIKVIKKYTSIVEEYKEDEIYWVDRKTGLKCKGKPDYWIKVSEPIGVVGTINYLKGNIDYTWLFDFKIGSGEIYKKIKDRRYLRQLSFYAEAIKEKYGYVVDKFTILYFNISTLELEPIEICLSDIEWARCGGYYTPDFYNQADNMFCTESQLSDLKYNGIWKTPNPQYYIKGWRELLDELAVHIEGTQFLEDIFGSPIMKDVKGLLDDDNDLPF